MMRLNLSKMIEIDFGILGLISGIGIAVLGISLQSILALAFGFIALGLFLTVVSLLVIVRAISKPDYL
jgi:hypothetical protein